MANPKISVIIVYKDNNGLHECIESAVQQSFSNIEVICVNNGSKDGAEKTAQDSAAKIDRIKLISLPSRLDDSSAKYAGLAAAEGEFAVFIENNEISSADFIKNLYLEAQKDAALEIKNKYLYRRSFLESGRETALLIKDAAAFAADELKKETKKEFDKFSRNNTESINGSTYSILTRFNALEKEFYDKDKLVDCIDNLFLNGDKWLKKRMQFAQENYFDNIEQKDGRKKVKEIFDGLYKQYFG